MPNHRHIPTAQELYRWLRCPDKGEERWSQEKILWSHLQQHVQYMAPSLKERSADRDAYARSRLTIFTEHSMIQLMNNVCYRYLTNAAEKKISIPARNPAYESFRFNRVEDTVYFHATRSTNEIPLYSGLCTATNSYAELPRMCAEVAYAVRQYKATFWSVAQHIYPRNPAYIMLYVFGKEDQYTKAFYEDANFDWSEYFRVQVDALEHAEFTRVQRVHSLTEHDQYRQQQLPDGFYANVAVIADYYQWLPLESAWQEHCQKNNIAEEHYIRTAPPEVLTEQDVQDVLLRKNEFDHVVKTESDRNAYIPGRSMYE